ncbi:MAG: hypothetical protein Fur0012_14840 [Elusimicrobiota bacterium]
MLTKIILLLAFSVFSQTEPKVCEGKSFPFLGETLKYEIYWGVMNVGKAELKVSELIEISSACAYKIVSSAASSSFIENFYPVDDYNEAWPDISLGRSYGYYKSIKEGKYIKKEKVLYDYAKKIFSAETENKKGEKKSSQGELSGDSIDVLSALYLMRTVNLKKGESCNVRVNTRKSWEMKVLNRGSEKVETKAGKFKCDIIEPQVGGEGIFVPREGKKLLVYISKDSRLPVLLRAEIFIGSITAKLVKIEKTDIHR